MSFPAKAWLGYGIDMTSCTPSDITSVTSSVLKLMRLIKTSSTTTQQTVNGQTYAVPDNTSISMDVSTGESSYTLYKSGTDAATSFQADASLSAKYMAVSGSVDATYAINKTFHNEYQYALFSYNQHLYVTQFEDFASFIQEAVIKSRINQLKPFDPTNNDVVDSYRSFFKSMGSHCITGASYGSRMQLSVWASNSDSSVNSSWGLNVSAAFNGLVASGKFDASVKSSDEYKTFSNYMQKTCSCFGGDTSLASTINSNPMQDDIYTQFTKWVATSRESPDVMSFSLIEIWTLMNAAVDQDLVKRAIDVQHAYEWIVQNPRKHWTKCRFVINSDWAEVGLLTPSAFIMEDPDSKPSPNNLVFTTTKIQWGKEWSHAYQRDVTIDFLIVNDGSPVDIQLSHGSGGSTETSGECRVTIFGKEYINNKLTDNVWNSTWEYTVNVNPTPHL
ncbi:hypothetical protein QCA50_007644 [Cerrena zonata]|uniref:MACPF domain-containing protein n=1 Tax=Cerrena zonata TaxID=2478898 RepID=A0AAW0GFS0_9APHY